MFREFVSLFVARRCNRAFLTHCTILSKSESISVEFTALIVADVFPRLLLFNLRYNNFFEVIYNDREKLQL